MPSTNAPSGPRGLLPGKPITARFVQSVAEGVVQRQLGAGGIQVKRFGRRMVIDGSGTAGVGLAGLSFTGEIETAEQISANRWQYTITEGVPRSPTGYTLVGPESPRYRVTATNRYEDGNGSSGLLGIGVFVEDIPDGFALQPVKVGNLPVTVFAERLPDGSIRWRIHEPNGISGQCPTDDSASLAIQQGS
jgi:hypothetical protein